MVGGDEEVLLMKPALTHAREEVELFTSGLVQCISVLAPSGCLAGTCEACISTRAAVQ